MFVGLFCFFVGHIMDHVYSLVFCWQDYVLEVKLDKGWARLAVVLRVWWRGWVVLLLFQCIGHLLSWVFCWGGPIFLARALGKDQLFQGCNIPWKAQEIVAGMAVRPLNYSQLFPFESITMLRWKIMLLVQCCWFWHIVLSFILSGCRPQKWFIFFHAHTWCVCLEVSVCIKTSSPLSENIFYQLNLSCIHNKATARPEIPNSVRDTLYRCFYMNHHNFYFIL